MGMMNTYYEVWYDHNTDEPSWGKQFYTAFTRFESAVNSIADIPSGQIFRIEYVDGLRTATLVQ